MSQGSDLFSLEVGSPLGPLSLFATEKALVGLYLEGHKGAPELEAREAKGHPVLEQAARELSAYFDGELRAFEVPVSLRGTAFQEAVWAALREIPCGERISYSELAERIGRPNAVRAVGAANAKNPVSIIVPCHRVVGSDGSLTGYAGGEARKEWLLAHEQPKEAGRLRRLTGQT